MHRLQQVLLLHLRHLMLPLEDSGPHLPTSVTAVTSRLLLYTANASLLSFVMM